MPEHSSEMRHDINHKLRERIKELTLLHKTARILQDDKKDTKELFRDIVRLIPDAWQYPEIVSARIRVANWEVTTVDFRRAEFFQQSAFRVTESIQGLIEVFYTEARPDEDEGPFLKEERDLIESMAEILRSFLQRKHVESELLKTNIDLEKRVEKRTEQLRNLAHKLFITEARERREIASDLHDHVGQALALIKFQILQFRSNAIFCGFENQISEILTLLDQSIRYTRDLTGTISPPVLYELGLIAALEWLAERTKMKYGLDITVQTRPGIASLPEKFRVIVYKCVSELVANIVKHAHAMSASIRVSQSPNAIEIEVVDDGRGFDAESLTASKAVDERFGLFSIRERLHVLGGRMQLTSRKDQGTSVLMVIPI